MTTETYLSNRSGIAIDQSAIEQFQSDFHGQVILPHHDTYPQARRIWNANIDKKPGMIARCAGTVDVVKAVQFAQVHNLVVAVRGGGHNVGGRALCDDGIVIDLSGMRGVHVDAKARTVRVQGGALLGDVDRETHLFGLAVPLGVVSKTGVAGLTLGGGVGWLARKYGLACDNLLSCDVVTAKGDVMTADEQTNADLLWGLRGGGGNFGIVTSFLFRAHPVSTVLGGMIAYPRDQAVSILRHYRDFMKSAPDELTASCGFTTLPNGVPVLAILLCYCGDIAEGERCIQPIRTFGRPLFDAVRPTAFPAMQKFIDNAGPENAHSYWKSAYVKDLNDDLIDIVIDRAAKASSPYTMVVVEMFGGAAGRIPSSATAFAQRDAEFNIQIAAQWLDPSESNDHIGWARATSDAIAPHASGGYFLNYLGDDEAPTAIKNAFGSNLPKLVELKKKYDPENFFHLNQNIDPRVLSQK